MVYIASRDWSKRSGWSGKEKHPLLPDEQKIDVYSNLIEVELFVNEISLGKKYPDELNEATWKVYLKEGENIIKAIGFLNGEIIEDMVKIHFKKYNLQFNEVDELAVNVGANYEFEDHTGLIWLPDQRNQKVNYGFENGESKMVHKHLIISGTSGREPIINYYCEGLTNYSMDIPDGSYEIKLIFAESEITQKGNRVFDVSINDIVVLRNFDLFEECGFARSVYKTFRIEVENGEGLNLNFSSISGKPILNALSIRKL